VIAVLAFRQHFSPVFLMVPQIVRKLIRGGAAAFIVLLASVVFAPSKAEASCGDYVMIGGQHVHKGHSGTHEMPGSHDPTKPRCHGPSCSNGSFPPAAPAPRIVVTVEQWAIPDGTASSQSPQSSSLLADTRDLPCDGFGSSILRPPR
jgi:hypothetical protein